MMNLPTFRFCFTKRSLKAMVLKRVAVIFPCDVFFLVCCIDFILSATVISVCDVVCVVVAI